MKIRTTRFRFFVSLGIVSLIAIAAFIIIMLPKWTANPEPIPQYPIVQTSPVDVCSGFQTMDSVETVMRFYKDQLESKGWTGSNTNRVNDGNGITQNFYSYGDHDFWINAQPISGGETLVWTTWNKPNSGANCGGRLWCTPLSRPLWGKIKVDSCREMSRIESRPL